LVIVDVLAAMVAACQARNVHVVLLRPDTDPLASVDNMGDDDVAVCAYADDITLVWRNADSASVAMTELQAALDHVGLELARPKCVLVGGAGVAHDEVSAAAEKLAVVTKPAAVFVGVPIGNTSDARALLIAQVKEKAKLLQGAWFLRRPMAEHAFLRHCGLATRLTYVLQACGDGVVNDSVLALIDHEEAELMRHVFGVYKQCVTATHLDIASLPCDAGGFGWPRVCDIGLVDGGRWRCRTKDEKKAHLKLRHQRIDNDVIATKDQAWLRRVSEMRTGTVAWWESKVALRVEPRTAGVEELALAMAIGVPVVPPSISGKPCPYKHTKPMSVSDGTSCHLEQCAVSITHSRHDATKDQLKWELKQLLKDNFFIDTEWGLDAALNSVKRQDGAKQADMRVIGDVYVKNNITKHEYFIDVGWKAVGGVGTLNVKSRTAAQQLYDEKVSKYKELGCTSSTVHHIVLAISTSGVLHPDSRSSVLLKDLSVAAWKRIVATGIFAQAHAAAVILQRMHARYVGTGAAAIDASKQRQHRSSSAPINNDHASSTRVRDVDDSVPPGVNRASQRAPSGASAAAELSQQRQSAPGSRKRGGPRAAAEPPSDNGDSDDHNSDTTDHGGPDLPRTTGQHKQQRHRTRTSQEPDAASTNRFRTPRSKLKG
jgi:hypothetical protein